MTTTTTTENTATETKPETFNIFATIIAKSEQDVKGGKRFVFRIWDIKNHAAKFVTAYASEKHPKLIAYYEGKNRKDRVSINATSHIYNNRLYYNVWSMFDRNRKTVKA